MKVVKIISWSVFYLTCLFLVFCYPFLDIARQSDTSFLAMYFGVFGFVIMLVIRATKPKQSARHDESQNMTGCHWDYGAGDDE